jgi:hypothetical protein
MFPTAFRQQPWQGICIYALNMPIPLTSPVISIEAKLNLACSGIFDQDAKIRGSTLATATDYLGFDRSSRLFLFTA